jgi:integrase
MAERLTDVKIRALQPRPTQQFEVWDSAVTGLGVRVSPSGTKSFVYIYRLGTRPRRMTLGRYPSLSLRDARDLAHDCQQVIRKGGDPAQEKKDKHQDAFAFDEFVNTFISTYAKPRNRSWRETDRMLQREFVTVWRKRDIRSITKADVTAILDPIVSRGKQTTANRAYAHVRKLFNWAVERGHLESSPCQGLRTPARKNDRDRVLSDQEIISIWKAGDEMAYPFGAVIKLLFLTGQRRNEVTTLRWDDLDLDKGLWSLAAERNKSGRAHVIPLSPQAIAVIKGIPKTHDALVFPARGKDNPISGFSKWKRKLDKLSTTTDWTLHDIRRTVSTGLAKQGISPHVTERVLNHKNGTLGGVAGVYNRFGYLPEMREALEEWAQRLDDIRV